MFALADSIRVTAPASGANAVDRHRQDAVALLLGAERAAGDAHDEPDDVVDARVLARFAGLLSVCRCRRLFVSVGQLAGGGGDTLGEVLQRVGHLGTVTGGELEVVDLVDFSECFKINISMACCFTSRTCSPRPDQKISEEEAGAWGAPQIRILWSQANVAYVPGPGG